MADQFLNLVLLTLYLILLPLVLLTIDDPGSYWPNNELLAIFLWALSATYVAYITIGIFRGNKLRFFFRKPKAELDVKIATAMSDQNEVPAIPKRKLSHLPGAITCKHCGHRMDFARMGEAEMYDYDLDPSNGLQIKCTQCGEITTLSSRTGQET